MTGIPTKWSDLSLEQIRARLEQFADDRDWHQYHTPRNLLLALMGEVGELSEIFQWRGECLPGLPDFAKEDRVHLGEELADVLLYLIRLADRCGINLPDAASDKFVKNGIKYPVALSKGSNKKYDALEPDSNNPDDTSHAIVQESSEKKNSV